MSEFTDLIDAGNYLFDLMPSTNITEDASTDPTPPEEKTYLDALCDINAKDAINIKSLCPLACKALFDLVEFIKHRGE
ncbi:hypothetical protein [Neorickettsia sp. 179522]|uniref:hypothetical protein n=1 Tax=Neorickettsia sp. 179522 TaxID=1714371 RepID=UPI0007982C9F|nr:hypothetical protein [Neorickettsia sp. 179522]KYH12350.1 hypothetical protein AS219_00815 [Neorickettsia sp. 179522]